MELDKFMALAKIGPKGQIVIPKEVREMFGLQPGDSLLLLADKQRGIALERYEIFRRLAEDVFAEKSELLQKLKVKDGKNFIDELKNLEK